MTRAVVAAKRKAPRVPFAILLLALIAAAMTLLLLLNTASAANEVTRHDAALSDETVSAQLVQLQNEIASSAAPANIASVARSLGMVPAGNPAFLRVDANGKVTLLGSPAPATAAYTPPPAPLTTPKPKTTPTPPASSTANARSTGTTSTGATAAGAKSSTTSKSTGAAKPSSAAKSTSAAKPSQSHTTPAPSPNPTPTPTPTQVLPGGPR